MSEPRMSLGITRIKAEDSNRLHAAADALLREAKAVLEQDGQAHDNDVLAAALQFLLDGRGKQEAASALAIATARFLSAIPATDQEDVLRELAESALNQARRPIKPAGPAN